MAKVMTKAQVVSHLANEAGLQKRVMAALLEELVALAVKECKRGGQFVVPGLGKAVKAHRKPRTGRNPQTGAPIKIPAKTAVKFRLVKSFKDAVIPPRKEILAELARHANWGPGAPFRGESTISLKKVVRQAVREMEQKIILQTLRDHGWNRRQTARALNISYRALLYKTKEAGVPPKRMRSTAGGAGPSDTRPTAAG